MTFRNLAYSFGLVIIVVISIILTLVLKNIVPQFITSFWPLLILLFTVVSVVVYFTTMKVKKEKSLHKFTNFYMAVTVIKLLLYLAVILVYAIISPVDAKAFIVTFFVYYLCFTIFETYFLAKKDK